MTNITKYSPTFRGSLLPSTIFDEWFKGDDIFSSYKSTGVPYNVVQSDAYTRIEVALAGFKREEIQVQVLNNELHIQAQKKVQSSLTEDESLVHKGISERSVQLKFRITSAADVKQIESAYKDGLLSVTIPAQEESAMNIKID